MIIAVRTDSNTAHLELLQPDGTQLECHTWEAGRQLSSQLLDHMKRLLTNHDEGWGTISGVILYRGPGSFTGLRIGATVANTIAYAQQIPIVGTLGDDWVSEGISRLQNHENDTQVLPHYGAEPNITKPSHRTPPQA